MCFASLGSVHLNSEVKHSDRITPGHSKTSLVLRSPHPQTKAPANLHENLLLLASHQPLFSARRILSTISFQKLDQHFWLFVKSDLTSYRSYKGIASWDNSNRRSHSNPHSLSSHQLSRQPLKRQPLILHIDEDSIAIRELAAQNRLRNLRFYFALNGSL